MATPQDNLPDLSDLAAPPDAPRRAAWPRLPSRRPPAPVAGGLPDLSDLAERPPARASKPRASSALSAPGVDPRLDSFVNEVIGEASKRTGYRYELGEGVRTPAQQAQKVAQGYSWTMNSRHLHGRGRDVLAFDEKGNYIKDGSHPAYAALGEVYGERSASAPARIRWGVVRDGKQVDPGHFELEDGDDPRVASDLPDLSDLADASADLSADAAPANRTRTPADHGMPLRRRGSREDVAQFNSEMSPQLDALGVGDVLHEEVERRRGVPYLDPSLATDSEEYQQAVGGMVYQRPNFPANYDDDGEPILQVSAVPATSADQDFRPPHPPARDENQIDPYSSEGRARRDAQRSLESAPNVSARLRVQLPLEYSKLDGRQVGALAAYTYARSQRIPDSFVNEWLQNSPVGQSVDLYGADGQRADLLDLLGSPSFDEATRTLNVSAALPLLSQMKRDYEAWRSSGARLVEWFNDPTRSAGEKFGDITEPVVSAAGRVGDLATRPLQAASTALWSLARKHSPTEAARDAYTEFMAGATPDGAGNWLAEQVRDSETLRGINENLPGMVGGIVEMVTDPGNLIPLGVLARGGAALRGLKGVQRVEQALLASRDARFLDFYNAGGRILKIEAAPIQEAASVADDLPSFNKLLSNADDIKRGIESSRVADGVPHFKITLKDADGVEHVIDTSAYYVNGQKPKLVSRKAGEDIEGVGLERDGDTGRVFFDGKPQDFRMEAGGRLEASPVGGARAGEQRLPSADEWQPFPADSGSLNVPRSSMPQIKGEHRGALVQYLKGRGIAHERVEIVPNTLKPSQAEFSPAKVEKARGFEGKPRAILVSSDGHVLDGHHQWLSSLEDAPDVPIPAIRLDAPINQLLIETARFPSSGVDTASAAAGGGRAASAALPELSDLADEPLTSEPAAGAEPRASAIRRTARDVRDVVNLTKAIPASFDNSALFGQGAIISGARPSLIPGAVADSTRSAMSRSKFEAFKRKLVTHPNQDLRESSGLYLASIKQGEETFGSHFAEKIPGVAASQRAYEATLDSLRSNAFDLYAIQLTKAGVTDPKAYKDIARWVNVATGRGELGRLEPLADVLNLPLFSPRLLASKFNVISPVRYMRMHPAARKVALKEMFRASGSLAVTHGLAKLAGADVDLNPFSGGFGTIEADGTSYDLSGGRLRALRFAAQLSDSFNRQLKGLSVKDDRKPAALVEKFFRAYLSPAAALGLDAYTGTEFNGRDFEWSPRQLKRLAPFVAKEMFEAYQNAGAMGAVKAAPSFVGVGVRMFDKSSDPIKPTLSRPVQDELDRLGLDLAHLGKKGKTSVYVKPGRTVEGVTGDSITPFGDEKASNGMGMSADDYAARLSAELDAVISDEINSLDWDVMTDEEKARRLDILLVNTEKRVFNLVRVDARFAQQEQEKQVKERLDRMSARSLNRGRIHFKL
ncbi:MAG TPA: hypothetical protein VIQ24_24325 [Pyrinomonadaceae bacterium]